VPRPPDVEELQDRRGIPVYFVLLPDALLLDVSGPAEVMRLASKTQPTDATEAPLRFRLHYVSPSDTIETSIGLPLRGLSPLPDSIEDGGIIVIAGTASTTDVARLAQGERAQQAIAGWLSGRVARNPMQRVLDRLLGRPGRRSRRPARRPAVHDAPRAVR
jgi:hypothetical protein